MIKVSTRGQTWWQKFINHYDNPISGMTYAQVNAALNEWRAEDMPGTEYIAFQTQEDYTLFLLRWS